MKERFQAEPPHEQKEKPKVLYHASPHRDLEEIQPRGRTVRDPAEGQVIFAAPDPAVASMFMFESDGRWVMSGKHNDVPYVAICADREKFLQKDKVA